MCSYLILNFSLRQQTQRQLKHKLKTTDTLVDGAADLNCATDLKPWHNNQHKTEYVPSVKYCNSYAIVSIITLIAKQQSHKLTEAISSTKSTHTYTLNHTPLFNKDRNLAQTISFATRVIHNKFKTLVVICTCRIIEKPCQLLSSLFSSDTGSQQIH